MSGRKTARKKKATKVLVEVEVTKRDIDRGERGKCDLCPVALAVRRRWRKRTLTVSSYDIKKYFGMGIASLPPGVCKKISTFDHTGIMKPFKFKVRVNREDAPRK